MSYVSLYRRYRPRTFSEVVGQRHVIDTLQHAIREDRLHHAYLFAGPRGTGKTTIARILAMAVNASGGPNPEPDPDDPVSVSIREGQAVDVIELDMASHGGVDDARELRDRVLFAPAELRRKVYILDEVHMASPAAFNALLKLIEEPPAHVLFAMATTEPQKVLPTILSRVQRLDLRRVPAAEVAGHVRHIAEVEGFAIDGGAVEAVVRAGDGSVRDTLSVLEQVRSYGGDRVTVEHVVTVLGQTPAETAVACVDRVAAGDLAGVLALVQDLLDQGHDLRRFALDLVQHLRDLLVLQVAPDRPELVDATEAHRRRLADQAGTVPRETLVRALDLLGTALADLRTGPARLPLEVALAKIATPVVVDDLSGLADRVARLEAGGTAPAAREPAPGPALEVPEPAPGASGDAGARAQEPASARERAPGPAPGSEASETPDGSPTGGERPPAAVPAASDPVEDDVAPPADEDEALARIQTRWPAILEILKEHSRRVEAVYAVAEPLRFRRGILTVGYEERYRGFHAENAVKSEFSGALGDAIERSCGVRVRVDVAVGGQVDRRPQPPPYEPEGPPARGDDDPGTTVAGDEGEAADVREAELADDDAQPTDPAEAVRRADELLRAELGAEPIGDDAS